VFHYIINIIGIRGDYFKKTKEGKIFKKTSKSNNKTDFIFKDGMLYSDFVGVKVRVAMESAVIKN